MIEDAFIYRKAPIHQPFSSPHLRHVWRLSSIKEYPPSPMPFILMRFILMGFIVDVTIIPDKIKKPDLSTEVGLFVRSFSTNSTYTINTGLNGSVPPKNVFY